MPQKNKGPKPDKNKTRKKKSTGRSPKKTVATPGPSEERFVRDLLVRGEAAKLDSNGKLPIAATHIIKTESEEGGATVKRARLKYF